MSKNLNESNSSNSSNESQSEDSNIIENKKKNSNSPHKENHDLENITLSENQKDMSINNKSKSILSETEIRRFREEKQLEIHNIKLFTNPEKVEVSLNQFQQLFEPNKNSINKNKKANKEASILITNQIKNEIVNQLRKNSNIRLQQIEYKIDAHHNMEIEKLMNSQRNKSNTDEKDNKKDNKDDLPQEIKIKLEEEKCKYANEFTKKLTIEKKNIEMNKKKRENEKIIKQNKEIKLEFERKSMEEEDKLVHKRMELEKRILNAKAKRLKKLDAFKELNELNNMKKYSYFHEKINEDSKILDENHVNHNNHFDKLPTGKKIKKFNSSNKFQSLKSLKPIIPRHKVTPKKEPNSFEKFKFKFKETNHNTQTLDRVLEEEKRRKEEQKEKEEQTKLLRNKMKAYGEIIKQTYKPMQSEKKANELQIQINKLKHPVLKPKDVKHEYIAREILPKIVKHKTKTNQLSENETSQNPININLKNKNIIKNKTGMSKMQNHSVDSDRTSNNNNEKEKVTKINYLEELKQKRKTKPNRAQLLDWKSDMNNDKLNIVEKINRISMKASQLKADAEMKEKLIKCNAKNEQNIKNEEEAADMYVDAIRAKLAILENFK